MFGWEFPPHISGGLGTACYGLTQGLTQTDDTGVLFVVPRAWGDENAQGFELLGANHVPVAKEVFDGDLSSERIQYLGIKAGIIPYLNPEQFWKLKKGKTGKDARYIEIEKDGTVKFTGDYGENLFQEIRKYALVAAEIAAENEFDVIHAHDWLAFPAGIAAGKASGKPLIVHVHATEFDRAPANVNSTIYSIEREGMEMADKVITVSNLTRNTVISKYGIPPGKVITVYNAAGPLPVRKQEKISKIKGMKTVTFLGRITAQKGPEYFTEAANMILKRMEGVRFVMAGSGDMMYQVVEHAARLGITDRFHFTGFLSQEEVWQLLDITDVFVMPSVSEPFGIAPLEAMLAGVPVIISRQSGVAEVVRYATKIDFWDTCAMADAIYGLLKYEALARMFSSHGAVEAGNLKWKHTAGIIRNLYQEVTAKSDLTRQAKAGKNLPVNGQ